MRNRIIRWIVRLHRDDCTRPVVLAVEAYAMIAIPFTLIRSVCGQRRMDRQMHDEFDIPFLLLMTSVFALWCYRFTLWHNRPAQKWWEMSFVMVNGLCAFLFAVLGMRGFIPPADPVPNMLFLGFMTFATIHISIWIARLWVWLFRK